jgi:catechol 2,3-dioxygenase
MADFVIDPETRVGSVHLSVADLERASRFYTQVLGFRATRGRNGDLELTADGVTPLIVLREQPNALPKPPRSTGLYHFAILTPSRPDLARSFWHLLEAGYALQGAADHLVSEALYLADPDGNGIEIYADRPREAWPHQAGQIRMATEPLDAEGLLAELKEDERSWSGLSPQTRMGHVHLHVADLHQAQTFYCDSLGFEVMARYGPSALFVSAGGYHHHIGLNTWAGVGAPPPPPGSLGLHFYTIHLPNRQALERTVEHLTSSGVQIDEAPDGIELQDPSGNRIQLTLGSV